MKKAVSFFAAAIIMLLSVCFLPAAAVDASENQDYSVESVEYTAELMSDGSAVITENWTVAYGEDGSEGFSRNIVISDSDFEYIIGISDMSVSADGYNCSEDESNGADGTYSYSYEDNVYSVFWNMEGQSETHEFSLRYIQSGAVKIYNGRAYFYCNVVNENSELFCRNVTIFVTVPEECFPEDFTIIESGSLAGEKSKSGVVFKSVTSMGGIKIGLSMPSEIFDSDSLIHIVDDYTAAKTASGISGAAGFVIIVAAVVYFVNYKKIFRKRWERRCRKKAREESSYETMSSALYEISPAKIMKTTLKSTLNKADMFIVTALELISRGYITAGKDGFNAELVSENDAVKRKLCSHEKAVIEFVRKFSENKDGVSEWDFYDFVNSFNKKVKTFSPFAELVPKKRKLIRHCFEIKLAAEGYETVSPVEISDDFFTRKRYSVFDLLLSVTEEAIRGEIETDESKYPRNLFTLRRIYDEGKAAADNKADNKKDKKR
ncbi:MAG: DUF2207 domain-containing protein [Clostridiales bacterium]|nr:DUF2207 domain-containing protein [Clostridiales bacterium]